MGQQKMQLLLKGILANTFLGFILCCGPDDQKIDFDHPNYVTARVKKREASLQTRKACQSKGDEQPNTRVDTTKRLEALRNKLQSYNLDAFLVPSGDSHQSEYVAKADKRREWIGGFSGSSGFAVITKDKAAMWTDGRYYIQAEDELDCNWLFMKGQEDDDASWFLWLKNELAPGSRIGADPSLTGALTWIEWKEYFDKNNLTLVSKITNPIDEIWMEQPKRSKDPLEIHDVKFAGKTWKQKISDLRKELQLKSFDAMVITALDEIGWLFNLRGNDIPFTPFFRAYAVIDMEKVILYLPLEKHTQHVKDHLNNDCQAISCVEIREYEDIFDDLSNLSNNWENVLLGKKWAYSGGASYAVYGFIPESKRKLELSPIMLMKAQKNEVEISGMKAAYIRDSAALIEFADILEKGMKKGEHWTEIKAAKTLEGLRSRQKYSKGPSFSPISAYGPNAAIIHYKPNNNTNTKIGLDAFFLLDTGGQYLDGTTDVSRTFHYGNSISEFEKEVYTRVLMGSIDLARATFLDGTPDTRLDILARWNLYKVGLNYRHGTGHGIGAYGFIHESPIQVRVYASEEHPMKEGYFFSDEPGYYEPGVGGIRLETVLRTVKRPSLKFSNKDYGTFLGFEPVCLVPFEPKLINYSLLTEAHIEWLNYYNNLIRERVGPELKFQGKQSALKWMMARTETISNKNFRTARYERSGGPSFKARVDNFLIAFIFALMNQNI